MNHIARQISRRVRRVVLAFALDKRGALDATNPATWIGGAAALVAGGIGAQSTLNQTAASANTNQSSTQALSGKLAGMVGGTASSAPAASSGLQ